MALSDTAATARDIRAALRAAGDPGRAVAMRTYLKSDLPCHGVPLPDVRAVVRTAVARRPPTDVTAVRDLASSLWDRATHREERHAALAVVGLRPVQPLRSVALLDTYERMIVEGAWWDLVDELAHRVGDLLADDARAVRPRVVAWIGGDDVWLRRVSIIGQLGARGRTDRDLLRAAIIGAVDEQESFLRKAIGWALRDYAKHDPDWVRAFVAEHTDRLSPLSRREALKHL